MTDFFRRTFKYAGALAYLGEAAAHVWVLCTPNELKDLKWWADAYFLILGGYATIGLLIYPTQVKFRGCRWCVVYWITTLWTLGSVLLHAYILFIARSHEILKIFPNWYSWIGLAYCLFFTWYLATLKLLRREE
jgi:hypothetical protein